MTRKYWQLRSLSGRSLSDQLAWVIIHLADNTPSVKRDSLLPTTGCNVEGISASEL